MGYQEKNLKDRISEQGIDLEIVKCPRKYFWVPAEVKDVTTYLQSRGYEIVEGFKVLAGRWVIERIFAWIGHYRRISKDYEFLIQTQETMMLLAMMRVMLRRTTKILNTI